MVKPIKIPVDLSGLKSAKKEAKEVKKSLSDSTKEVNLMNAAMSVTQQLNLQQKKTLDGLMNTRKIGFDTLLDEEKKLSEILGLAKERLKAAEEALFETRQNTQEYKDALDLVNKQRNVVQQIEKRFGNVRDRVNDIQNPFQKMLAHSPLGFLGKMTESMRSFNNAAMAVEAAGGMTKLLGGYLKNANSVATLFSKNITTAFKGGLTGAIKGAIPVIKTLLVGFKGLLATLSGFAIPVAAIVAGLYLIKKIWDWNIGGIQTSFFSLVGQLRTIWGQFQANLSKGLQKLSPLFKFVFGAVFKPLIGILKVVGALFNAIFVILDPILDALGEIGKALLAPFEAFGKQGQESLDIFNMMVKAIGWIAKAVGFLIKIALAPLVWQIKLIAKVGKGIGEFAARFKWLLPVIFPIIAAFRLWGFIWRRFLAEPMKKFFEKVKNWFQPLIDAVKTLGNAFKLVTDPVKLLQMLFKGMELPDWLQKVVDFFTGGTKKIAGEEKEKEGFWGKAGDIFKEAAREMYAPVTPVPDTATMATEREVTKRNIQKTALSPQTSINNVWNRQRSSQVNNNNNVTIQTSSPINQEHAPRIADIMVNTLQQKGKMQ